MLKVLSAFGFLLVWLPVSPGFASVSISGNRVLVDTSRYSAEFEGGLLRSLKNKLIGGAEMVAPSDPGQLILVRMGSPPGSDMRRDLRNPTSVRLEGDEAIVQFQSTAPEAVYSLRIGVDSETEDLVVRAVVSTPGPLYQRVWYYYPDYASGHLLLPMWGGTLLPYPVPEGMQWIWGRTDNFIDVPAIIYERNDHAGGFLFWAHLDDTRIPYSHQIRDKRGGREVQVVQTHWNRPARNDPGMEFRLNSYARNWSYGASYLKRGPFGAVDNAPPAWLGDIDLVYNTPHLRDPNEVLRVSDIQSVMDQANYTFPSAEPLRPQNILLYHNDWSADGHDRNYPDYATNPLPGRSEPTPWKTWVRDAKAAGFPTMPHFNSNQVARYKTDQDDVNRILGDHPAWVKYMDHILREWRHDRQKETEKGWMTGPLSADSMFAVSLGCEGFRDQLRDRILAVLSEAGDAPAAFLDVTKSAWCADDINPKNDPGSGQNFLGLQHLIADLRSAGKVVGGELNSWETAKAGQHLCQVFPCGAPDFSSHYKYMCAVSGCLLSDSQVLFGHLAMPSPDAEPENYFRQYIACFFQGALQNVRWPAPHWAVRAEARYDHRGKIWANERALYALNHDVEFYTGPSELWSEEDVLIVERVDGRLIPRREAWLVKMLVCDWYWIYGGRAPTEAEFAESAARSHLRDGSLIAELRRIHSRFSGKPTPPERVEPRGLALKKIAALFPEYPLVRETVRWQDALGEHVVSIGKPEPSRLLAERSSPSSLRSSPRCTASP